MEGTRGERILVILLVGLLVLLVVIIAYLLLGRGGDGEPAGAVGIEPTPILSGHTAHSAYALAQATAVTWQADASLLRATATWPQGMPRSELIQGEAIWTFTFYSPATQSVATLNVAEGQATLVNSREVATPIALLDAGGWQLDSDEAIQRMLESGGDSFFANAGLTTLSMNLDMEASNNRVEWLVSLLSNQTASAFNARIDATTGEILEVVNQTDEGGS